MREGKCGVGLLLALAVAGCGGTGAESPNRENLTRAWQVTQCEYVDKADASRKVDLVAQGWTIMLYVNDNGAFFYAATPPGGAEEVVDGTWSVSGETVTLAPSSAWGWTFVASVQETSMTLRGADAEYDFDGDGTPEPATWNLAMRT